MTPWKTALIGFGKIGASLANDPIHIKAYPYATHAQVLRDHPAFDWVAVVDPSEEARNSALHEWGITETAASLQNLPSLKEIEVAVIATPPSDRIAIIETMPSVKAVLVEKPFADSVENAELFLDYCQSRQISVLVCLPRHFDGSLRKLAGGELHEYIGQPMAAFATYGNGLANNGTHLIDMINFMLGEIVSVQAILCESSIIGMQSPISGDINIPFSCNVDTGLTVMASPLNFEAYREVGLDIWGESGRFQILHEGYTFIKTPRQKSRLISDASEISHDIPSVQTSTIGHALYSVYDNLSSVLQGATPHCSGEEALSVMRVVEAIRQSALDSGISISCTKQ